MLIAKYDEDTKHAQYAEINTDPWGVSLSLYRNGKEINHYALVGAVNLLDSTADPADEDDPDVDHVAIFEAVKAEANVIVTGAVNGEVIRRYRADEPQLDSPGFTWRQVSDVIWRAELTR